MLYSVLANSSASDVTKPMSMFFRRRMSIEILDRALAEDWQHPELVAIVEHRGHVRAHDRHRAADRSRDHRDCAGIEKVALGEFVALSRGPLLRTGSACEQSPKHANGNANDCAHEIPPQQFCFQQ
jgi:hypothetical protein